jgi:hypothetical protein
MMKKLFIAMLAIGTMLIGPGADAQKKWSSKAKGAVIGAGSGAAAGAVINKKNRSKGAIIGGVVGSGIGYMYGRRKDKKREELRIAAANRAAASQTAARHAEPRYPVYSNYRRSSAANAGKLNSEGTYSAFGDESYEAYYNRRKSW